MGSLSVVHCDSAPPRKSTTNHRQPTSSSFGLRHSDFVVRHLGTFMATEHEIEIRVRYSETDAMGFLYHGNYFAYFEMGRTELLRSHGGNYRQMEEDGLYMVVVNIECK